MQVAEDDHQEDKRPLRIATPMLVVAMGTQFTMQQQMKNPKVATNSGTSKKIQ